MFEEARLTLRNVAEEEKQGFTGRQELYF